MKMKRDNWIDIRWRQGLFYTSLNYTTIESLQIRHSSLHQVDWSAYSIFKILILLLLFLSFLYS